MFPEEGCGSLPSTPNRLRDSKYASNLKENFPLCMEVNLPPSLFIYSYNQDSTKQKESLKYTHSQGQRE